MWVTSSLMPMVKWFCGVGFRQLFEDPRHHRRREFLRRQPIAAADDLGERSHRGLAGGEAFGQGGDDVLIQRLADAARFLGAVQHGNALHRRRQRLQEVLDGERPHQAHLQHANLAALRGEVVHGLLNCFCARAHDDDDVLGIRRAFVLEEPVFAADELGELVHRVLHDGRTGQVVRIHRFAALEVNVGVLRRAAQHRMVGRERALAMSAHQIVVDHGAHIVQAELFDLGNFMRGAEAVEEMQEGNARLQGGGVRDQRQVHRLLHRVRRQQGESGLASGHGVLVIAENGQRLRGDGARGNVNDRGRQFARDLVHVGDHQQQALRRGERGAQRARLQCAVQRAGSAAFALHLDDVGDGAPDVLFANRRPRVRRLAHGRGRRNGINGGDFADVVGHVGDGFVAVEGHLASRPFPLDQLLVLGRRFGGIGSTACLGSVGVIDGRGSRIFSCFHVDFIPQTGSCARSVYA